MDTGNPIWPLHVYIMELKEMTKTGNVFFEQNLDLDNNNRIQSLPKNKSFYFYFLVFPKFLFLFFSLFNISNKKDGVMQR